MSCLSRMQGNLHVRFLGEGVTARSSPYPPRAVGSIPIARSIFSRKPASPKLAFLRFQP